MSDKSVTTKTAEELWDFVVDCSNSIEDGVREIQLSIDAAYNSALENLAVDFDKRSLGDDVVGLIRYMKRK